MVFSLNKHFLRDYTLHTNAICFHTSEYVVYLSREWVGPRLDWHVKWQYKVLKIICVSKNSYVHQTFLWSRFCQISGMNIGSHSTTTLQRAPTQTYSAVYFDCPKVSNPSEFLPKRRRHFPDKKHSKTATIRKFKSFPCRSYFLIFWLYDLNLVFYMYAPFSLSCNPPSGLEDYSLWNQQTGTFLLYVK